MRVFTLIALVLMASVAMNAQSQAIDGNLDGYVRSQDGNALLGAHIRASNLSTGFTREADADDSGYYVVQLLPPGTYSVTASKEGFNTSVRSGVTLLVGQVVRVDMLLPVGNVQTVVQVTDDAPVVEVGRTSAYSNVYTEREARNIPLSARNPLQFYIFNPILNSQRNATTASGTQTPSVVYAGYGTTQFNVDGVSNNLSGGARNVVISAEAIAEYQTLTSPPAEYGRNAGLVLNSISRSGTNDWHGSLYSFTKQKELSARPFLLAASAPTPSFERYNYGTTLAGPVVKDKAFFFLNYERWAQNSPLVSTFGGANQAQIAQQIGESDNVGSFISTFRAHTVTVKGDVILNAKNRLALRYNMYNDTEARTDSGAITKEVSSGYLDTPQSGTAQLVTVFNSSLLNEFRFLYGFRQVANPILYPYNPAISLSGIGTFNGNANGNYQYYESGYQILDNLTWNRGRHSIKTGFEILPANYQDRTTNWNGTFTFAGLAATTLRGAVTPLQQYLNTTSGLTDPSTGLPYTYSQFSRSSGAEYYDASLINTGFFVQDDVRLSSRLKLNAGVRYEVFVRPGGNLNPAYPQTGRISQDYKGISPRTGISWDPFGSGKTVVRAGYGLYNNPAGPASYDSWMRQNGVTVKSITVLPTQTGAPAFTRGQVPAFTGGTAAIPNIYEIASDFKDGQEHNWHVGVERQLSSSFSLSLSYLGARAQNMTYNVPGNLKQVGTLSDGRIQFGGTANRPDANIGTIYTVQSAGTYQNYNALLVMLRSRPAHGLSFQAGYQYQHIAGCLNRSVPTATGACFNEGTSSVNQPNRFTVTAVWEPRLSYGNRAVSAVLNGWMLANSTIVQNGFPYDAVTGQDNNGDGTYSDRPAGFGLYAFRMPLYVEMSCRLSRKFVLGEFGKMEIFGEALNATNHKNVYGVNTTWGPNSTPNTSFGTPTSVEAARQWQMGMRYSF